MKHEDKITFLKVLQKLDDRLKIKEEILPKLKEKLRDKDRNEKEKVILDLVESINKNNSFSISILKEIETNEIIEEINKRVMTKNPDEIRKIEKNHILLVKILVKDNFLGINFSENYIANILNILENLNSTQQIYNYFNNYNHPNFQNTIQKIIFTEEFINDLLFFHVLNLYLHDKLSEFLNQNNRQNQLKILIASYIKVLSKIPEAQKLLVPLSIVIIFANVYNQMININNFGGVNTNEIFNIINQSKDLEKFFTKYLKILKELDLLYDFLRELENGLNQINENYIKKILKIILDNGLYSEKLLIDFCILFSSKVPDEYKKTLMNKNKENEYWYKDLVLENLSSEENILHDEALKFLQFIENWHKNKGLKEKVKEFIKNNISQLLEKDNIFNIYKILIENGEKFYIGYANELGEILFNNYKSFNHDNEKLKFIFQNIESTLSQESIKTLVNAILTFTIDSLEEANDYQYKITSLLEKYIDINESKIREIFDNLITKNIENMNAWKLFDLLNKKVKLSKNNKNYILQELKKLEKSSQNKEKKEIISQIINNIEVNHAT